MKKTSKIIALLLSVMMVLSLAACGEGGGNDGENTAPKIAGVADQAVEAGSQFDALAGVTATDAEDGDLTGKITVTSNPALTFSNGKATPESAGSYELTYSVTDKGGKTTEAYATLTVTRKTGEAVELYNFNFADYTPDSHGWTATVGGAASAAAEAKQGAFVFDIANPGDGDGDIKLSKSGFALKAADYKIKVWAKATKETYAHMFARNEAAEGWELFGDAYNLKIGTEIAPIELNFTSAGEGTAELLIHLGKISPNPDNPADTTPSDVTVTIDKIEIYETTGANTEVPVYTNDYSAPSATALVMNTGDGANGSVAGNVFTIANYPTEGGVWSVKADMVLEGVTVEADAKYYYKVTLVSQNDQSGELLVESASQADQARANFNGLDLKAGEEKTIENVFTAEKSVDDPVIRMQIGNPGDGVTANTITVKSVEFGKLEGDQETHKTIDSFSMSVAADPDPDYIWTTYNGTDEDNERGVGTVWTEGSKLCYRIDQGGTVDWHNKLILGHGNNELNLPADSYFTVTVTGKASKNVSCGFFLSPRGNWDPRLSETIDFTTEEQTFTFETTDTLIMEMPFEMLFQFGSAALADMGEVTVEISNITIYQRSVM